MQERSKYGNSAFARDVPSKSCLDQVVDGCRITSSLVSGLLREFRI